MDQTTSDTGVSAMTSTSSRLRLRGSGSAIADTAIGSTYGSTPFPIGLHVSHNPLAQFRTLYTDDEVISATYAAGTSSTKIGVGAVGSGTAANFTVIYQPVWRGAKAHKTRAQVKSLWVALGWSIPWT